MGDYYTPNDYLNSGTYPTGFSKNQQEENVYNTLEFNQLGVLYFSSTSKSRAETGVDRKRKMAVGLQFLFMSYSSAQF